MRDTAVRETGEFVAHHYPRHIHGLAAGPELAQPVAKAYGLSDPGLRFLTPQDTNIWQYWARYHRILEQTPWTTTDGDAVLDATALVHRMDAGPILLVIYFGAPALTHWPYGGASPDKLIRYAHDHALLFCAGGWLQATGALLSVLFFLVLLQLSGTVGQMSGLVTIVDAAVLLALVVIEAALLEAVPIAAANHDAATVATTFALSNGVFARIFPLAPAPLLFAGIGFALQPSALGPLFAKSARIVAAMFVLAGIAAVFSPIGLIFAIVMSVVEAIWILWAGAALLVSSRRIQPAAVPGLVG